MASLKILVSGDVNGNFNELFTRVSGVNKKNGPFEMLLCIGSFFGEDNQDWAKYINGDRKVPITTYILGPCKPEHQQFFPKSDGCEMCPNITYLGKKGILIGSSGLQVAYLSGIEGLSEDKHYFSSEDVECLQASFSNGITSKGVDILLTCQWPKGVNKFSRFPKEVDMDKVGSDKIAKLACSIRPRYHFSGLEGIYYERLPYRNHQVLAEAACHTTRFIALAPVGNAQKQKWLYAFSITPLSFMCTSELAKQPSDVTECPYKFAPEEIRIPHLYGNQQFFYDTSHNETDTRKRSHREQQVESRKHPRNTSQSYGSCWFCLGSPEIEKHLVVSVGDEMYLALAKGGLTPDHSLILPVGHHQSTVELPDECFKEMEQYKNSLRKYFLSVNKTVVFFERNYRTSHLQIQVVPVPILFKCKLKEAFQNYAITKSLQLDEIPKHSCLKQIVPPGAPYFYVELEEGEKLLHRIKKNFPLQFGREIIASKLLLNITHKTDWKECTLSKEEECKAALEFKKRFQSFDFTLR